ncbi:hypothetical protein [Streptomyces sp. NPDC050564]|uniref:hypothetical protein n=1 Tax=Streptomyces sp. NPDC050564 TaxID=3365631 RepID=UPI003796FA16
MTATAPVPVPTPPVRKALARLLGRRRQTTPQVSGASAASGALPPSGSPAAPVPDVPGQGAPEVGPGVGAPDVWLAGLRLGS